MIVVEKVFFCDNFERGQYGKLNITGFMPTNILNFDKLPYIFTTFLIVSGTINQTIDQSCIEFGINSQSNVVEIDININAILKDETDTVPMFLVFPVKYEIHHYGFMKINIKQVGIIIYEDEYKIVEGDSPNITVKGHSPISKFFHGQDDKDSDFVVDLLHSASRSLKIFDDYIDPISINKLLSKVDKGIQIQILTLPKHKHLFSTEALLNTHFTNLEVKFSTNAHDRFVIINDSEYYHFGHSLKDVANKKLSRFTKIVAQSEVDELNNFFNNTWSNA